MFSWCRRDEGTACVGLFYCPYSLFSGTTFIRHSDSHELGTAKFCRGHFTCLYTSIRLLPNGFLVVSNDSRGARGKLEQNLKGSVKGCFRIAEKCRHTDSGAELVF